MQEIGSQEDAATEAHEQREDSPATIAVSVDARYHMMRDHSEYERQQKRQDEANQLRQPAFHLSVCCTDQVNKHLLQIRVGCLRLRTSKYDAITDHS